MNTYVSLRSCCNFAAVHNTQVIMPGNSLLGPEMSVLIPEYRGVQMQISNVHKSMEENLGP